MMLLSKFVITLLNNWAIEDLPINVLIDGKYYDIEDFYFDDETNEYMLKLEGAIDYETRGEIVDNYVWKVIT